MCEEGGPSVVQGQYSHLRPFVARVLVPGLYVCLLLSALLALGVAALIISVFWFLIVETERIPLKALVVMLFVGVGGLYGAVLAVYAGWKAIGRATVQSHSILIRPIQAPGLWNMLAELSRRMKIAIPDNVLVEFGASFYVTEANVSCFSGTVKGRSLCVSAPLLHFLTPLELKAVLAHELSHFTGADTYYSTRFYPVYRGTTVALRELYKLMDSKSEYERLMLLPQSLSVFLLEGYLRIFSDLERKISRERETRADSVAAGVVSAEALGSALKKVYGYGNLWSLGAEPSILEALRQGSTYPNLCDSFTEYALQNPQLAEALVVNSTYTPPHPTDAHPQLGARLSALGVHRGFEAPTVHGPTAACLVPALRDLEEDLSALETQLVATARF